MDLKKSATDEPNPTISIGIAQPITYYRNFLYNALVGILPGSSIGDVLGASTEMWKPPMSNADKGYLSSLTLMVRAPSAEGTCKFKVPYGGTTDDTRWMTLLLDFITKTITSVGENTYKKYFHLDIYELGFAKEISGHTAGMVVVITSSESTPDIILSVFRTEDPLGYSKSRLVSQMPPNLFRQVQAIIFEVKQTKSEQLFNIDQFPIKPTFSTNESPYHAQLEGATQLLDEHRQSMSFHAAENDLVTLTALIFGEFDLQKAIEFVFNYVIGSYSILKFHELD